jgi:3-oxoacyl-(acyl-carrier-protein) synthase
MLGTERVMARLLREQRRRFGALRFHECAGVADVCARLLGARGPCATVSTACSAGAMAIAAAAELIRAGEADLMLAGGSDSLCRLTLNGFGSLLLLDPSGCRPFDARRAGISLGEGAAMLVLEAEETACARGARILARLTGWGASCDAWHATAPHPEGRGAFAAMQKALERAGLQPADIDFVCAHGTGTPDNDAMEAKALKRLWGDRLPPVASIMRFFGHTLAASGAIKAVVCVQALQEQHIPANPGFEQPDQALGLEPVRQFQPWTLSHLLSNSFGFGGNNVVLVLSKAEAEMTEPRRDGVLERWNDAKCAHPLSPNRPTTASPQDSATPILHRSTTASLQLPLAVIGAGGVSAAGSTMAEVAAAFHRGGAPVSCFNVPVASPPAQTRVYACGEFGAEQLIETRKRRRLSRFQQMALVAAGRSLPAGALSAATPERVCVVLGTGLGSLGDTAAFVENLVLKDEHAARPLCFTNSVHNSLASQVALELDLQGLSSTPIQREICFEAALWQGAAELLTDRADLGLVGAADELNSYLLAAGMRWGWWNEQTPQIQPFTPLPGSRCRPLPGEGSAVFALARSGGAFPPLAWVSGIRIGRVDASPGLELDAEREAKWILEALERSGSGPGIDALLTGGNGWAPVDHAYQAVAEALARLTGRQIPCLAYKSCCGEHHSASAFGFLTAIGLVRGEIPPAVCASPAGRSLRTDGPCRKVVLYTLSPSGVKGMCCVCA